MDHDYSKRYYLFGFEQYYPGGGFNDFIGSFDTLEEVEAARKKRKYDDYHQIFDSQDRVMVLDAGR